MPAHKTVYLLDKNSGQRIPLQVKGHGEEQNVQVGIYSFSMEEYLNKGTMTVVTSDDINQAKKIFRGDMANLAPTEGQATGATALTTSPFSSFRQPGRTA